MCARSINRRLQTRDRSPRPALNRICSPPNGGGQGRPRSACALRASGGSRAVKNRLKRAAEKDLTTAHHSGRASLMRPSFETQCPKPAGQKMFRGPTISSVSPRSQLQKSFLLIPFGSLDLISQTTTRDLVLIAGHYSANAPAGNPLGLASERISRPSVRST